MRHIIPISGKDSTATAIVQMAREPDLDYEFMFCDTRMELPETYRWIEDIAIKLGINIIRVGKSLEDVIAEQNMLPSQNRRFCTKYSKIFPIRDYIGGDEAIQYIGIRADEAGRAGIQTPHNIAARFPLIELGIGIAQVYRILDDRAVMPPDFFWERLHATVLDRHPRYRGLIDRMTPWDRSAIFAWRSRSNCFNCFYQRQYEWVGLLEHHPGLFDRAEALEWDYGVGDRRPCDVRFSWIKDLPLSELRVKADEIFRKRVKQVCIGLSELSQGRLFVEESQPITLTSCGVYCGK